jgi:hypothetical protein
MGDPVVLPKFELPGDKPHWGVRVAWITGGLLLLSVVGLGAVIMHHRNLETQARVAKIEAIEKLKAEHEAKIAAALAAQAAAKARKEAEIAAKLAAQTMPATTMQSAGEPEDLSTPGKPGKRGHGHRSHTAHVTKGTPTAPRPGTKLDGRSAGSKSESVDDMLRKKPGRSASSKADPIDELLKKMK